MDRNECDVGLVGEFAIGHYISFMSGRGDVTPAHYNQIIVQFYLL